MKLQETVTLDDQPTWRLWGEERVDGAVYTVYLKKVRYHTPSKSITSESDDDISHLEWETVRVRFIKAGTLEKLVESLASETGELESTYINVFLATYRTFTSPKQVLNLLIERYDLLNNERCRLPIRDGVRDLHRKTLRQALHVWLEHYPEDFDEPPNYPCLSQLEAFGTRVMPESELNGKIRRLGESIRNNSPFKSSPLLLLSHPDFVSSKSASLPVMAPPYTDFLDIPDQIFAQQLTKMDYELFKRVIPHQCLGSVWSSRDKFRDRDAASVVATVEQFNAVSYRVITTIVGDEEAKPSTRAKIMCKWIDITQQLRVLKNFSSLKAIISGLQSNPVYRLKKAWSHVTKDKLETFEELARIFSEENNALAQRELLVREGTARFADTVGENDYHLQKILQKHSENSRAISYGTIPYLGTFLTDLTMIDTAIPDIVADGLINFDKRRKEFEVLAQIKLLQGAANAYHIDSMPRFMGWWSSLQLLDENEAFEMSCRIEPTPGVTPSTRPDGKYKRSKSHNNATYHKKNDSLASAASSSSGSQFYCDTTDTSFQSMSTPATTDPSAVEPAVCDMSSVSSSSSLRSLDASLATASSDRQRQKAKSSSSSKTSLVSSTPTTSDSPYRTSEFYIIRVQIESSGPETEGVIMYKSIMIGNHERTREVIRNAMMKHGLEGSPENYTLAQLLPDKELLIPANANVYYAINTQHDLNFVLRERTDIADEVKLLHVKDEAPATPATGSRRTRDTSKARRKLLGLTI